MFSGLPRTQAEVHFVLMRPLQLPLCQSKPEEHHTQKDGNHT